MKHSTCIRRSVAALTALVLTTASLPAVVSSAEYNTWTGYVLRNAAGEYLSVLTGAEGEGASVGFCAANGVAAYNTWYFTESNLGVTLKSALSEGEYYLQEGTDGNLILSKTAGDFVLEEDGSLTAFRSGVQNPVYATDVTPEPVTNLHMGDWNHDGQIDSLDLSLLRQAALSGTADFAQQAVGNTDGSGTLDGKDIALLQRYLLGEAVTLAEVQLPSDTLLTPIEPVTTTTTVPAVTAASTTETTTETTTEIQYVPETTTTVATTTFLPETTTTVTTTTTEPKADLTLADMPSNYVEPMEWIWNNRINDTSEGWVAYWDTIYDQIVAEDGHLYYVIQWQSNNTISLEQRQQIETLLETTVNAWTDWLVGYDGWKYDHVDVEVVGWAVLDKSLLLDLQEDEIVYTDTTEYTDREYIIESNMASDASAIPTTAPIAPSSLYRYDNYTNQSYTYGENRFDMYLKAVQGMIDQGGFGWGWGQELSDTAILGMANGSYSLHILEHELGHGFGLPDFYGGEGEDEGYPVGGFPNENNCSIMMAGSSQEITDFDGWMLRYVWSQIKDESGRFSG